MVEEFVKEKEKIDHTSNLGLACPVFELMKIFQNSSVMEKRIDQITAEHSHFRQVKG